MLSIFIQSFCMIYATVNSLYIDIRERKKKVLKNQLLMGGGAETADFRTSGNQLFPESHEKVQ